MEKNDEENNNNNSMSEKKEFTPVQIISLNNNSETINLIKGIKVKNLYYKLVNVISRVVHFFQKNEKCQILYKNKFHIFCVFTSILSIILYHKSLRSCGTTNANICLLSRERKFYAKIFRITVLSSVVFSIFISTIIFNQKGVIHLLYTIPIYLFYFIKYQGVDTDNHGYYNSVGFIFISFICIPVFLLIFYTLYYGLTKNKKKFIVLLSILLLLILSTYKFFHPNNKCDGSWVNGLNNTKINNDDKYPCKMKIPKTCGMENYHLQFDFTKYLRPTCDGVGTSYTAKKNFLNAIRGSKYFDSKYNHFGYPITTGNYYNMFRETLPNGNQLNSVSYYYFINSNIIMMDKFNEINYPNISKPEIEIIFDKNNKGKIIQRINYNETLSKERNETAKNKSSLFNNVFILYEDSLSRKEFLRKLPKTKKLIEKYMYYSREIKEKPISSFQFFKYHNLHKITAPNVVPMFYGIPNGSKEKAFTFLKYYKESGFITGQSILLCSKEPFDPGDYMPGIEYYGFDHENIAMFCDPNYGEPGYSYTSGINSVLKRCLYGKESYKYAMEYFELFWNAYKDNKKFFRLVIEEGHEFSLQLIKHLDDDLFNFLQNFINNYWTDDTILIIVSDHGNSYFEYLKIGKFTDDRISEGFLGTLFFLVPNRKEIYDYGIYDNLISNSQTLFTPYDIHNTLIHIAIGKYEEIDRTGKYNYDHEIYNKNGESLLNYLDYTIRTCDFPKFDNILNKDFCQCI